MINGATDELVTVRDWLRWAVSRFNESELFFGHGTDNAWDEPSGWCLPPCTCRATRSSRGSTPT
jgi:hypothetical protein